jgi:hypothetical protein
MGFFATPRVEGSAYARYMLKNRPNANIVLPYARGEAGREYAQGLRGGLGDRALALIVSEATFDNADPPSAIDVLIQSLRDSGARRTRKLFGSVAAQVGFIVRRSRDDVSRANVMRQAATMDLELGNPPPGLQDPNARDQFSTDQRRVSWGLTARIGNQRER